MCGLPREENLKYLPARIALVNVVRSGLFMAIIVMAFIYASANALSALVSFSSGLPVFPILYTIFGFIVAAGLLKLRKAAFTGQSNGLSMKKFHSVHVVSKASCIVMIVLGSIIVVCGLIVAGCSFIIPAEEVFMDESVQEVVGMFGLTEMAFDASMLFLVLGIVFLIVGAVFLALSILMLIRLNKVISVIKGFVVAWETATPMTCKFTGAIVLSYIVGVLYAIAALSSLGSGSVSIGDYQVASGYLASLASFLECAAGAVTIFMEAVLFSKLSSISASLASQARLEAEPVQPQNNFTAQQQAPVVTQNNFTTQQQAPVDNTDDQQL